MALNCYLVSASKCHSFNTFFATGKYPLLVKINGSNAVAIENTFGGYEAPSFSIRLSQLCVNSVNIYEACFNLFILQHVNSTTL